MYVLASKVKWGCEQVLFTCTLLLWSRPTDEVEMNIVSRDECSRAAVQNEVHVLFHCQDPLK